MEIKIICDFQTSPFCKKAYIIGAYSAIINRRNNNGQYRCKLCAINETHLGCKSHYFKNFDINHNYFNKIDTELKAYLLGVIAGDGSVSTKSVELVANNKDIETLILFQQEVAKDVQIRDKFPPKGKSRSNCSVIKFISRIMVNDLCKHLNINPGKKSDKISLPNLNEKLMMHFIRGLVDTDGCIDNPNTSKYSPRCFYSSTSVKMIDQLQQLFKLKNISSYKSGIKLYFSAKYAIQFMDDIYKNANFFLKRKKDFYDIWKTWSPYEGTSIRFSKRKIKRLKIEENKTWQE